MRMYIFAVHLCLFHSASTFLVLFSNQVFDLQDATLVPAVTK